MALTVAQYFALAAAIYAGIGIPAALGWWYVKRYRHHHRVPTEEESFRAEELHDRTDTNSAHPTNASLVTPFLSTPDSLTDSITSGSPWDQPTASSPPSQPRAQSWDSSWLSLPPRACATPRGSLAFPNPQLPEPVLPKVKPPEPDLPALHLEPVQPKKPVSTPTPPSPPPPKSPGAMTILKDAIFTEPASFASRTAPTAASSTRSTRVVVKHEQDAEQAEQVRVELLPPTYRPEWSERSEKPNPSHASGDGALEKSTRHSEAV